MSLRGAEIPKAERLGNQLSWAVVLSALLALTIGPLDTLLNFLAMHLGDRPPDQTRVGITLAAGLLFTLFCFAAFLTGLLALLPACRLTGWSYRRVSLILTACPFAFLLKFSLEDFSREGLGGLAAITAHVSILVLAIAAVSYLGLRGLADHAAFARRLAWSMPAVSLGGLAFVYQQLRVLAHPASPAWTVGAPFAALVWMSILFAAFVAYRLSRVTAWSTASLVALSAVFVIGALGFVAVPVRNHKSQGVAGRAAGQRNVVLISIDTLRADHLGAYGAAQANTPNIDRLAADGAVFENAYTHAPWTFPGVSSFLTGLNPVANGTDCRPPNCSLGNNVVTLGERFRDAGYRTAAFGNNPHIAGRNLLQGISEYRFGPFITLPQRSPGARFMRQALPAWFADGATSDDIADNAIDWLERNHSERFFLWVHFLDPHIPYSVAPPDSQAYPDATKIMNRSGQLPDRVRHGEVLPQSWVETIKVLYDLETTAVDSNVGRLLNRLKELGLYDDAVILLTSDHGEELWDHGSYEHGHTLYDELLRVPLIVKAPSISPSRVAARVATTQAPRTLLQAAGLQTEDIYLAPPLPGNDDAPDATLLLGATLYFDEQLGIIFDNLKYIRDSKTGAELLFDLDADPVEQHPLTDEAKLHEARRRLAKQLEAAVKWRKLFVDEAKAPQTIPPDLLRSLGYL